VFELARRLGLGERFWDGDVERAWRAQLAPSGLSLEAVRTSPGGVRVPLDVRYREYADRVGEYVGEYADRVGGRPRGFATPTRKVEIYSELFLDHGYAPLPDYVEPRVGHVARPELAARYPLVLTCAKLPPYCHSQHRNVPSLRRLAPDPELHIHPEAAGARGIADGDWVVIATPDGEARARARLDTSLDARVVVGQHGWWGDASYNAAIGNAEADPISGSIPHRAYVCEVRRP
jgi:anaerobic selenocysteine-containing dehydrogenase